MKIVRQHIKKAIENATLEELLVIRQRKESERGLSPSEYDLVLENICNHCRFFSAHKECCASARQRLNYCLYIEH